MTERERDNITNGETEAYEDALRSAARTSIRVAGLRP
jgi:hypothetical protein